MVRVDETMPGALPINGPLGSWGCEVRRHGDGSGDGLLERLGPGHCCLALGYNGWLYREGEGAELELSAWGTGCLEAGAAGEPVVCYRLACGDSRAVLRYGLWEAGDRAREPDRWDGWERGGEAAAEVDGAKWRCAMARMGLAELAALPAEFPPPMDYLGAPGTEWSGAFAAKLLLALGGRGFADLDDRRCPPVLDAGGVYVWTYGDPGEGPALNFVWREGSPLSAVMARAARAAPSLAPASRSYAVGHLP